jgi:hypothetical protein
MGALHPLPAHEGHYWAKLKLADNPDNNSADWEVVQVFDNILRPWCEADIETGECMMASVPGVQGCQPLDAFVWGPSISKPEELR